ncbi:NAD kinase 2, mitochondrial [Wyeomyia smithii]|uniref:NAD kinase 2, mitochondrial n=1 Tax=Wyeomyia smithii TaxID=174621 RepID=UPI002467DE98|nr:NAD kinase 2, mitochondrial [Wyeomyia smithii]XP_055533318.1 NAD kinase 2, mitochondrial [Wyeomyia smithii]XP_055533319.1 NAD kinase 2, mitochondrial [Wyeomyia smithii]XP_055533320.1 NAD kinase 2, mitochondrial [Wyeomyia smithii]
MLQAIHLGRTVVAGCSNVGQSIIKSRPFGTNPKAKLRRVLVVSKLTRLEFEKTRDQSLSDEKLEDKIRGRGSDYDAMKYYHHLHKDVETEVVQSFRKQGIEVKVANRLTINNDFLRWADMVVPIGGDGTFLLAAGRASPFILDKGRRIPVVGFNSDPRRSEGRLMLPKYYSTNVDEAVTRILDGNFNWMQRSRIRITLVGNNTSERPLPIDLHEYNVSPVEHEDILPFEESKSSEYKSSNRILPHLALNEVFIGEMLSARVSHLHLRIDNSDVTTKTKSSGLCVSTGTGSTSWLTSMNRLSASSVRDLIEIIKRHSRTGVLDGIDPEVISDEYNRNLVFPTDDPRLCYSIREQICVGVWPNPKGLESRGYAKQITVKSRCIDASLVIDGSIAYNFNDGAKALLEVYPEDALLTIDMN